MKDQSWLSCQLWTAATGLNRLSLLNLWLQRLHPSCSSRSPRARHCSRQTLLKPLFSVSIHSSSHPLQCVVCTMPLPMQHVAIDILPFLPERSPVAVVPLETPHCARLKMSRKLALQPTLDTSRQTSELHTFATTSSVPKLLQLLP